jgi:carbamate kinase
LNQVQAHQFELEGWKVIQDAGRGWRRVVASPEPLAIVEQAAIEQAVAQGWLVIAVGGGGVPVVYNDNGELRSVYAVVDKDRASALLAARLHADLLLISTGVEKVAIHYRQPNQRNLDQITLAEAQRYQAEGHFAAGSMGPKIEACIRFLEQSTNPAATALITDPANLQRALQGATGTRIVQNP